MVRLVSFTAALGYIKSSSGGGGGGSSSSSSSSFVVADNRSAQGRSVTKSVRDNDARSATLARDNKSKNMSIRCIPCICIENGERRLFIDVRVSCASAAGAGSMKALASCVQRSPSLDIPTGLSATIKQASDLTFEQASVLWVESGGI
jgi:hypothetical protein